MSNQPPSVGRIVHYVSYGTPGGEFLSEHRAAIIAAVGYHSERAEEPVPPDTCDLVVFNPGGLFFNTCPHDEETKAGGTWHWPERTDVPTTTPTGAPLPVSIYRGGPVSTAASPSSIVVTETPR